MATSLFQITSSEVTNITFTDYLEYKTAMWLWRIFSPLLIIIGTFGNLLSLLVLTRKRLRSSPAMFYLSILAVVDITVLYSGLMRVWLENVYNIHLREMSEGACRFHTFFVYFILSFRFQVWVAVADPMEEAVLELGWAVANIFQYTNNSIHFFLYCLTGPRFRREFVSMFKGTFGQKRIEPSEIVGKIARASAVSDK
ncbi:neuromedin-U receptor 1-like [Patella vulgata]|uniref:neuromedin-U receptor 1-like n=1 Tax=Patella vulgata TaxID=6465 RepID=UPI0024A9B31C|nr:neuromedin-U receptor 1-like [Patella vulgata]